MESVTSVSSNMDYYPSGTGRSSSMRRIVLSVLLLISISLCFSSTVGFVLSPALSRKKITSPVHHRLHFQSPRIRFNTRNDNDGSGESSNDRLGGRVGSSRDDLTDTISNPIDLFVSFLSSDYFSVLFGMIGLLVVVIHRWNIIIAMDNNISSNDVTTMNQDAAMMTYQTRSDLLAVFTCGSVLLNGLTKLDVTTTLAESVFLEGTALPETKHNNFDGNRNNDISWALESLMVATPAKTALLVTPDKSSSRSNKWMIRSCAGIVPARSAMKVTLVPDKSPILDRVGKPMNDKETYLPTLQALPGKTEFTYLPSNTQCSVLIPIAGRSSVKCSSSPANDDKSNNVLILGGNTAKSFTPRDIAWCRIIADRIGTYI